MAIFSVYFWLEMLFNSLMIMNKRVPYNEATEEEKLAAIRACHPEACDEELEYVIWFNRLSESEKRAEFYSAIGEEAALALEEAYENNLV